MSRPSKLTDEAQDLYMRAVSAGVPPEVAACHAGFSAATLYRWRSGSTPRHAEFRRAHEKALASFEIRLTATVSQAALTDPRWAMELLERRFASRWARNRGDPYADLSDGERAVREAPIVLDPALISELVPRLLEAGRLLSGRPAADEDAVDISDFEDDGSAGDPGDDEVEK